MTQRLNIALVVALLLSSYWLIGSSHESRRLFVALDRARAQATPLRVEKLARDKLKMFDNSPARTHYVALSESGQVLSSSPAKVQEVAP
jgi:cell division protein FtsL